MQEKHIELIARAVIVHEGGVLLCRSKGEDSYFFPGGHVEFDEDTVTALKRELKEEVDADVTETRFIGVLENSFLQSSLHETPRQKHEMNVVFEAKLVSADIKNMEDHIESMWVPLEEFKKVRVLPVLLKEKVIQWMEDKEVFFGSEQSGKALA